MNIKKSPIESIIQITFKSVSTEINVFIVSSFRKIYFAMSDCETLETLKREVDLRIWNCFQPLKNPFNHAFSMFALGSLLRKARRFFLRSFPCCDLSSRVDGENSWIMASKTAVLFRFKTRLFLSRMFLASSVRRKLMVFFIMISSFWKILYYKTQYVVKENLLR